MKNQIKRIVSICIAVILLASPAVLFAHAETAIDIGGHDIWSGSNSRGNSPPTTLGPLPYGPRTGTINSYVFSDIKFAATSSKKINVVFSGTISSGTAKVIVRLYKSANNAMVKEYDLGIGSSWGNITWPWDGLQQGTQYYYQIIKTNGSGSLSYKITCSP